MVLVVPREPLTGAFTCTSLIGATMMVGRNNKQKQAIAAPFQEELKAADAKDKASLSQHLQFVDKVGLQITRIRCHVVVYIYYTYYIHTAQPTVHTRHYFFPP